MGKGARDETRGAPGISWTRRRRKVIENRSGLASSEAQLFRVFLRRSDAPLSLRHLPDKPAPSSWIRHIYSFATGAINLDHPAPPSSSSHLPFTDADIARISPNISRKLVVLSRTLVTRMNTEWIQVGYLFFGGGEGGIIILEVAPDCSISVSDCFKTILFSQHFYENVSFTFLVEALYISRLISILEITFKPILQ